MEPITYKQATDNPRVFMALQGSTGEGKTTSALTFPNPVLQSFDDNLPTQSQLSELGIDTSKIQVVPWTVAEWVDSYATKVAKFQNARSFYGGKKGPPNAKDCFLHYLANGAMKLAKDDTFILDSWTAMHAAFDRERQFVSPFVDISDKTGKHDPRPFWGDKLKYSVAVMDGLKLLPCNVIVIYHEKKQYDEKTGSLVDKIAPLQQGQFVNEIPRFYSDYYRQVIKPKLEGNKPVKSPDGKSTIMEYWWQIKSSDEVTCRSRLKTDLTFVPAGYQSLIKYGLISNLTSIVENGVVQKG